MLTPPLALIAAYSEPGRVIGDRGRIPWRHPEDLRRFKAATLGHAIIMGRITWDSLGRPLPGRRNLVVTRQRGWSAAGAEPYPDVEAAIAAARSGGDPLPFVIGGGQVYAAALPLATELHLTEVHEPVAGDAFFPPIGGSWRERSRETSGPLVFRVLDRG